MPVHETIIPFRPEHDTYECGVILWEPEWEAYATCFRKWTGEQEEANGPFDTLRAARAALIQDMAQQQPLWVLRKQFKDGHHTIRHFPSYGAAKAAPIGRRVASFSITRAR